MLCESEEREREGKREKKLKTENMDNKKIELRNGNFVIVESIRYAYDKCIFTYSVYQKDGYWKQSEQDNFSIGYYDSVEEYIINNL